MQARLALGFPASVLMVFAGLWASYLVARRLTNPAASSSLRMAATALVWLWLSLAGFSLLCAVHLFRVEGGLAFWIAVAAAAHASLAGRQAVSALSDDVRTIGKAAWGFCRSPVRASLVLAALVMVGVRIWAGLASPPLAWDALLYHAYKAGRWVQQGYQIAERAPDAWGYFEYFPHAGEVPLGWAMLGPRSDALLAVAGAIMWSLCPLSAYALARAIGGRRIPAAYAALAVGLLPALVSEVASTYADMFVLAAFLLGCAFIVEFGKPGRRPGDAALAGGGLGLMAAGKLSGLPIVACGLLFITWLALGPGAPAGGRRRLFSWGSACAAIAAPIIPGYVRALLDTGSPFYPLTVAVGRTVLFQGNRQFNDIVMGVAQKVNPASGALRFVLESFLIPRSGPTSDYLGFGPSLLLIAVLGLAGLLSLLRKPGLRLVALFLAVAAALPFIGIMTKGFEAQRIIWMAVLARLVLSLPAMLAVLGARCEGLLARCTWVAAIGFELWLGYPGGLVEPVPTAMRAVLSPILWQMAALALGLFLAWRGRLWLLPATLAIASIPTGLSLERARKEFRYPIYAASLSGAPAYVMHSISANCAGAWPIWKLLDDGSPHRIAASFGWSGLGHNAYRYPLLGSHFQNRVMYVPVTRDGQVLDYEHGDRVQASADPQQWIQRLAAERIDTVVVLHPQPIELAWIRARPALFEPIGAGTVSVNLAFRFHPERM